MKVVHSANFHEFCMDLMCRTNVWTRSILDLMHKAGATRTSSGVVVGELLGELTSLLAS